MTVKTGGKGDERSVRNAERVADLERVSSILGKAQTEDTTTILTEKPTVHRAPLLIP